MSFFYLFLWLEEEEVDPQGESGRPQRPIIGVLQGPLHNVEKFHVAVCLLTGELSAE